MGRDTERVERGRSGGAKLPPPRPVPVEQPPEGLFGGSRQSARLGGGRKPEEPARGRVRARPPARTYCRLRAATVADSLAAQGAPPPGPAPPWPRPIPQTLPGLQTLPGRRALTYAEHRRARVHCTGVISRSWVPARHPPLHSAGSLLESLNPFLPSAPPPFPHALSLK
uniref:Uncharacterized protein n=1 Tax=Mustela putorius furo TaxID=9669 RepID=M3XYH6_MUSPF